MKQDMAAELESQRKKVDVDNFDVTVRELVRMVAEGEIDRSPIYQRKFRWDLVRESKLIESVLLGLPVPTIFVATNSDATWELVDGLQRISTLVHFCGEPGKLAELVDREKPLELQGLEKLTSFNGKILSDLPEPVQLHFYKRPLRVTALSDKANQEVRFDTFERLNTGGVALTPQEIRSCVYRGALADFLEEMAGNSVLKRAIKLQSGHQDDGTMEEFVLKVFAYCERPEQFDGKVKEFLNAYARDTQSASKLAKMRAEFTGMLKKLGNLLDGPILKQNYAVTPLNLAEAIFVAALQLHRMKTPFKPRPGWIRDRSLNKFSSGGTNTHRMLTGRIDRACELLAGAKVEKVEKG